MSAAVDPDGDDLDPDDLPATSLDDDEYEAFLAREFDAGGGLKGDPRVTRVLVAIILALLAVALIVFL